MKRTRTRRHRKRAATRRNRHTRRLHRTRRAGMFRAAARHARRLSGELGKELVKDVADKTIRAALRKEKDQGLIRLSSGKLKRVKSRLDGASITPMNLSTQFESLTPSSPMSKNLA